MKNKLKNFVKSTVFFFESIAVVVKILYAGVDYLNVKVKCKERKLVILRTCNTDESIITYHVLSKNGWFPIGNGEWIRHYDA